MAKELQMNMEMCREESLPEHRRARQTKHGLVNAMPTSVEGSLYQMGQSSDG